LKWPGDGSEELDTLKQQQYEMIINNGARRYILMNL
jgi:hypothetical protein